MVIPLVKTQTIALSCPDCPLPSFAHHHCIGMLNSHSKTLSVKPTATRRAWRHSHPSDCFFVALGPHLLQPLHSAPGCSRSTQGASCRMIHSLHVIWDQAGTATACAEPQAQVHGAGKWEQPFFADGYRGISSSGAALSEEVRLEATAQGLMSTVREDYSIFIYCSSSSWTSQNILKSKGGENLHPK